MNEMLAAIEARLDGVIWDDERSGALEEAAAALGAVAADLKELDGLDGEAEVRRRGLYAFALMRTANITRQQGDAEGAAAIDREALAVARTADDLTLGRCLLSMGASEFASGRPETGSAMLAEARDTLRGGESPDHAQALGWSQVLYLDVVNAGLLESTEQEVVAAAAEALGILRTIHNWAGVARVLAALAALETHQEHPEAAAALQRAADAYNALAEEQRQ